MKKVFYASILASIVATILRNWREYRELGVLVELQSIPVMVFLYCFIFLIGIPFVLTPIWFIQSFYSEEKAKMSEELLLAFFIFSGIAALYLFPLTSLLSFMRFL